MAKIDIELWSLNYRLITSVITSVAPQVATLGIEVKELFLLTEIDDHPHPAALAERLSMPKPTVTMYLKRLQGAGLVLREIDPGDLRRHRLSLTPAGRNIMTRGLALLSDAFATRLRRLTAAEKARLKALFEKTM